MNFKGTQGKWECSEIMNFTGTLVSYIKSKHKDVAQLRGCKTGEEDEALANARLIESAPELFKIVVNKYKTMTRLKHQKKLSKKEIDEYNRITKLIDYILII